MTEKVARPQPSGKTPRRAYDSSARRARAQESRRRIVEAAADLFAEQGYAPTTLEQIAAAAGVSVKLVVANGPKRALLLAAFEQRFVGAEHSGNKVARATAEEIMAERDPVVIVERLADFVLDGQERGIGLWRAFTAAATDDPEVAAVYAQLAQVRRGGMRIGVRALKAGGILRPGPEEQHVGTLGLLMGFEAYQLMVLDWGWSRTQLRAWLVAALNANLVQDRAEP